METTENADSESPLVTWIGLAFFLSLPLLIGTAFSVAYYRDTQRLEDQRAVDRAGVEVDATVDSLEIKVVRTSNSGTGADREHVGSSETRYCKLVVSYTPPDAMDSLQKEFLMDDDSICSRYQVGDTMSAKILPDHPSVIVLEEGRLSEIWVWVYLALCIFFLGLPVLVILRIVYVSRKRKVESAKEKNSI